MRDIGRSLIDQLEWFGFQHEAKEFLVWFSFKNDGFAIETIIEEYFIGSKISKLSVTKNQAVVNVADMSDEEVMVGEKLVESDGPDQICSLMGTTIKHNAGERGLPIGLPRH